MAENNTVKEATLHTIDLNNDEVVDVEQPPQQQDLQVDDEKSASITEATTSPPEKKNDDRSCRRFLKPILILGTICIIITAITIGVIYGRPPKVHWKVTFELSSGSDGFGNLLDFSTEGNILAIGTSIWNPPRLRTEWITQVFNVDDNTQYGQNLPFIDFDDPTLPRNAFGGWSFEPSHRTSEDISISGDGKTIAIAGSVALHDMDNRASTPICNNTSNNICSYGRVTVYHYEHSEWIISKEDGPLFEFLLPNESIILNHRLSIDLSQDGRTIAIARSGLNATLTMYRRGEDTDDHSWDQIGETIQLDDVLPSVSLSGDGSRVVTGTFGNAIMTYDLVGEDWKLISSNLQGGTSDIYSVSLSASGERLAISSNETFGVYERSDDNDGWIQLGNDIRPPRVFSDTDFLISGDGATVVFGIIGYNGFLGRPERSVRVLRYDDRNGDWFQIGDDLVGTPNSYFAAISYDGNQVATGSGGLSVESTVNVFDLHRGL